MRELRIWNAFHSTLHLSAQAYSELTSKENKLIAYYPLRDYILFDRLSGSFLATAHHDRLNSVFVPDNVIIPSADDTVIKLDKDPYDVSLMSYGDSNTIEIFE